jgi:hypothetical protein
MSTSAPAAADGDPPASPGSWLHDRSLAAGLAVLASMVFLGAIIRLGWLSDDAFVSFRAIDNLVSGRGLVSNVGERVQGFTNPLWTLLVALAYWPSGDIYGSAMVLSLLCCLGTVYFICACTAVAGGPPGRSCCWPCPSVSPVSPPAVWRTAWPTCFWRRLSTCPPGNRPPRPALTGLRS